MDLEQLPWSFFLRIRTCNNYYYPLNCPRSLQVRAGEALLAGRDAQTPLGAALRAVTVLSVHVRSFSEPPVQRVWFSQELAGLGLSGPSAPGHLRGSHGPRGVAEASPVCGDTGQCRTPRAARSPPASVRLRLSPQLLSY